MGTGLVLLVFARSAQHVQVARGDRDLLHCPPMGSEEQPLRSVQASNLRQASLLSSSNKHTFSSHPAYLEGHRQISFSVLGEPRSTATSLAGELVVKGRQADCKRLQGRHRRLEVQRECVRPHLQLINLLHTTHITCTCFLTY